MLIPLKIINIFQSSWEKLTLHSIFVILDSDRRQTGYKKVVKFQIKIVGLTFIKKIRNVKYFIIILNFIQI